MLYVIIKLALFDYSGYVYSAILFGTDWHNDTLGTNPGFFVVQILPQSKAYKLLSECICHVGECSHYFTFLIIWQKKCTLSYKRNMGKYKRKPKTVLMSSTFQFQHGFHWLTTLLVVSSSLLGALNYHKGTGSLPFFSSSVWMIRTFCLHIQIYN